MSDTERQQTSLIGDLAGKRVLLTGATAGLGKRFASVLSNAGARVGVVARRAERLEQLAAEIPNTVPLPADLSRPAEIATFARRAVDALGGGVDVLVNNAATIYGGVKAEDESLDQIRTTLATNLVSPILLAQAVFPGMRERGSGSIINVTSIVAHVGIGRLPQATYAASKGGLSAITREWAAQWSRFGIRVNAIAPGFFHSEITDEMLENHPKIGEWIERNTMISRTGKPDDFDGALLFLASDASRYMTGQTIIIDGGWTAR